MTEIEIIEEYIFEGMPYDFKSCIDSFLIKSGTTWWDDYGATKYEKLDLDMIFLPVSLFKRSLDAHQDIISFTTEISGPKFEYIEDDVIDNIETESDYLEEDVIDNIETESEKIPYIDDMDDFLELTNEQRSEVFKKVQDNMAKLAKKWIHVPSVNLSKTMIHRRPGGTSHIVIQYEYIENQSHNRARLFWKWVFADIISKGWKIRRILPDNESMPVNTPPWERIEDKNYDRLTLKLWWQGKSANDISKIVFNTKESVTNRISKIRELYGENIVPYHYQRMKFIRNYDINSVIWDDIL